MGSEAPVKARRNGTAPQAGSAEDADHQADALKGKRAARKALTKADGKDPVGINSPLTGGRFVSVTQSEANPAVRKIPAERRPSAPETRSM